MRMPPKRSRRLRRARACEATFRVNGLFQLTIIDAPHPSDESEHA